MDTHDEELHRENRILLQYSPNDEKIRVRRLSLTEQESTVDWGQRFDLCPQFAFNRYARFLV